MSCKDSASALRSLWRSGLTAPQGIQLIPKDANTLLQVRDALDGGKLVFSAVGFTLNEGKMTFDLVGSALFKFAAKLAVPMYLVNYQVTDKGDIIGELTGPLPLENLEQTLKLVVEHVGSKPKDRDMQAMDFRVLGEKVLIGD